MGVIGAWVLLGALAADAPASQTVADGAEAAPEGGGALAQAEPPPAPVEQQRFTPPPAAPRRYGDAGTHHVGAALGVGGWGGDWGVAVGAEYGYFFIDGLAPLVQVGYSDGSDVLATLRTAVALRWLPFRFSSVGFLVQPRVARLFINDHEDAWGGGGTLAVIFWVAPRAGIQLGYDYLRLFPGSSCDDLAGGCNQNSFAGGLVVGF